MTLIEETILAARGVLALLLGQRSAPSYFDLSLRGLAGSAAAVLVALAVSAYLPALTGAQHGVQGAVWPSIVIALTLLGFQILFTAAVLRMFGRLDGLVPYLVADNWSTLYLTVLSIVLNLAGVSAEVAFVFLGLVVLVIEVNTARLIVTLSTLQILAFLVAQLAGGFLGLIVIGGAFPSPA